MSGSTEICPPGRISGKTALLMWGLPLAAIAAGSVVPGLFLWLATPAFAVMGVACVVNAARCGRIHCYATGPLFLAMAALLVGVALGWVPEGWIGPAGWGVVVGVALAFAAEWIGARRYAGRRA